MLVGAVLSALLFLSLRFWQEDRQEIAFLRASEGMAASVGECLHHQADSVTAVASFMEVLPGEVGLRNFQRATRPLVARCEALLALQWIPRVPPTDLARFETATRRELPRFEVGNCVRRVSMSPGQVDDAFPIQYMEPLEGGPPILGMDIRTDAAIWAAAQRARDGGTTAMTTAASCPGPPGHLRFAVALHPVYAGNGLPDSVTERRARLLGFAGAVFGFPHLLEHAAEAAGYPPVDISLYKLGQQGERDLVHQRKVPTTSTRATAGERLHIENYFRVAGEPWLVEFRAAGAAFDLGGYWALPWAGLVGGLLLSSLAGLYLFNRNLYTAELTQAHHSLDVLIQASPLPIAALDSQQRVMMWNRSAERLFGWRADEVLGHAFPGAEGTTFLHSPVRNGQGVELNSRRKDGSPVPVMLWTSPFTDALGQNSGSVWVFEDIAERKRLEQQAVEDADRLREQADELARADRRKDEFLAMLAHELRNPLAPIANSIAVLKRQDEPLSPVVEWASGVIGRQVEQLTHLVNDLLDVARITQGRIELARVPVSLEEIIERAVEGARPLIESHHHQLTVSVAAEPLVINGDAVRLVQVLGNLLDNASKYTPDGGRISLTAERDGQEAVVRVADNGLGIPAEMLPHVFDPFSQVDRTLSRPRGAGLGLGLNLAKQLVEMHDGRITADSPGPGAGAVFTLHFPLAAETPAAPPTVARTVTSAGNALRILVVEDNPDVADSFSVLLRALGHQVEVAPDGPRALEAVGRSRPQLVFLDIGLPGMNGYEVAQNLRSRYGRAFKIVAVTGYGQEADRLRTGADGFDDRLLKPVNEERLERLLANLTSA